MPPTTHEVNVAKTTTYKFYLCVFVVLYAFLSFQKILFFTNKKAPSTMKWKGP